MGSTTDQRLPILAIALGLAIWGFVFITATLITFILPESYASTARVKVEPGPGISEQQLSAFVPTERDVIGSEIVLRRAIEALNLNERWGEKYAGGERLKTQET